MMKIHIVLTVTIALITNKASCGPIENAYDKISNTTNDVKEDVYSWWTYGVDTVLGEDVDKNAVNPGTKGDESESGIIGTVYNKVKGGVSSGYMKIHDFLLGKDSDPNKGIIKTLYERAMNKIKFSFLEYYPADEKPESHSNEEDVKQEVLKLLFSNRTDIFNSESERSALNSLRNKLTQTGDEVLHLANNEKDVLRKAYESIRHKSDDVLKNAGESADKVKNKLNENIQKTQEFIQDESKKVNEAAKTIGEEVKKSASDIETV